MAFLKIDAMWIFQHITQALDNVSRRLKENGCGKWASAFAGTSSFLTLCSWDTMLPFIDLRTAARMSLLAQAPSAAEGCQ
jgi:hypothetical protein